MAKLDVPYLVWRDGRPRWVPGPRLRAAGHKGRDLKGADGKWLKMGAAIEAAKAINAAIDGEGASAVRAVMGPVDAQRSMRALFNALRDSPKFKPGIGIEANRKGKRLAESTRKTYLSHLDMLEAWCGDIPAARLLPADVEHFHSVLCETKGAATANAVMRTLSIAMNYGAKKLLWFERNPVSGLEMPELDGRLVLWTPEEINTFLAAADWCGRESAGDALILGLLTGQIRGDIIALQDMKLESGVYRIRRRKTGRMCYVPPTEPLTARLELMRKRKAERWPCVTFANELVCTSTGKPYSPEGSAFSNEQWEVRAIASGAIFAIENILRWMFGQPPIIRNLPFVPLPSILEKKFQDLRDTAVTYMFDAGWTVGEIANTTSHSLNTVNEILDKHYFVRNAEMAARAGERLNALVTRRKIGV